MAGRRLLNRPPPSEILPVKNIEYRSADEVVKPTLSMQNELQKHGQTDSIIVCQPHSVDPYTIVWGHKILETARAIEWKSIKAIVLPTEPNAPITKKWISILTARQKHPLSAYQIAEYATFMAKKFKITGAQFAEIVGVSVPYVYNTMRWYKSVPNEIKEAWKNDSPLVTQEQLERYAKMSPEEILKNWRSRSRLMTPFKPNSKNGRQQPLPGHKRKRATEHQIVALQASIDESPLTEPVKTLCTSILQFVLGHEREVPGITDYRKLPLPIVDKKKIVTN